MGLQRTSNLILLLAPLLSACSSMGFPHIGTVDTRHQAPGTYHSQFSLGAGATAPPSLGLGANLAVDTFLSSRLSLATSAHAMLAAGPEGKFLPGARLGLRYRPSPRLSIGGGAAINASFNRIPDDNRMLGYRADLEIATSRVLSQQRFESNAWRVALGLNPSEYMSISVIGDWSRSRPTYKPNIRFSYGINYGVTFYTPHHPWAPRGPAEPDPTGIERKPTPGAAVFIGGHLGIQFGSLRNIR